MKCKNCDNEALDNIHDYCQECLDNFHEEHCSKCFYHHENCRCKCEEEIIYKDDYQIVYGNVIGPTRIELTELGLKHLNSIPELEICFQLPKAKVKVKNNKVKIISKYGMRIVDD